MENDSTSLSPKCGDLLADVEEPGLAMLLAWQALGTASTSTHPPQHKSTLPGPPLHLLDRFSSIYWTFIPPTALGQEHDQLDVLSSTLLLFLSIGPEWPLNSSLVA